VTVKAPLVTPAAAINASTPVAAKPSLFRHCAADIEQALAHGALCSAVYRIWLLLKNDPRRFERISSRRDAVAENAGHGPRIVNITFVIVTIVIQKKVRA